MKREVVLITGCSTGIGRATAAMLATAGYEVVATARKPVPGRHGSHPPGGIPA